MRTTLAHERVGELFNAYDTAQHGLEAWPGDVGLKHRAVLALARAGATQLAERKFAELGLGDVAADDVRALRARILKDRALAQRGPERRRLLAESASAYEAVFAHSGNPYPGINAASLRLLAGDSGRAQALARRVLALLPPVPARPAASHYYDIATRIEALFVLGRLGEIEALIPAAMKANAGDYGALATTLRQLELLAAARGAGRALLARFAIPGVIHYVGHMMAAPGRPGRFAADAEAAVRRRIEAYLDRSPTGWAYGSLACGADILFVEALLRRNAQVVAVLPFKTDEFIESSVRPGGGRWVKRFHACMRKVDVRYATEDSYLGDQKLFAYASRMAMGLAVLRARHLHTTVEQVAVWDGGKAGGEAGTAVDVRAWRRSGRGGTVIRPSGDDGPSGAASRAAPPAKGRRATGRRVTRLPRAMLFGDIKGFSRLTDVQMPAFVNQVLGGMARVIGRYGGRILVKNTWGDGIFLVLRDAEAAADCALDIQQAAGAIDYADLGLPADMALRLGGHVGPVYENFDPIRRTRNFFGAHVSRAARVEPVTPPACVYVTESFAAALALDRRARFECEYVGVTEAAKKYGSMRMFLLRRGTAAIA
ncbi:MAG: adenylate/guanylate cyclase domain-containing protein [Alphaproteobacteria bacterium]|nr:adenylate/guanylate cyclase domain-containing protein [Alphaproteobacteria bacterium]